AMTVPTVMVTGPRVEADITGGIGRAVIIAIVVIRVTAGIDRIGTRGIVAVISRRADANANGHMCGLCGSRRERRARSQRHANSKFRYRLHQPSPLMRHPFPWETRVLFCWFNNIRRSRTDAVMCVHLAFIEEAR